MSDKLTAENIVKEMPHHAINGSIEGDAWLIAQIKSAEQAAREEGYTQGCADTIHNSPMFEEQSKMLKIETDAAFEYGLERGQEIMRERAKKEAWHVMEREFGLGQRTEGALKHHALANGETAKEIANTIRALPIDSGERKS